MKGLRIVSPGNSFTSLPRPPGLETLPFRVQFECVDILDRTRHVVLPHRHDHYEVIVVEGGAYDFLVNRHSGCIRRNGLVVLKPGDQHEDRCHGSVKFLTMRFKVLPGPTPQRSFNLFAPEVAEAAQVVAVSDGACHRLARRAIEVVQQDDPFAGHVLDAITLEFVWELARLLGPRALAPKLLIGIDEIGFSSKVHDYFERRASGILRLAEMAAELGMSERTLSSRCRAVLGDSPKRLFVRRKMEHARTLMVQTDLSVKDISEHLGFENPYHFSTVYKRIHGVSPSMARLPK